MKRTRRMRIAVTAVLWIALGGTALAARPTQDQEVALDLMAQLEAMQSRMDRQDLEIEAVRTANQRLHAQLVNLIPLNDYVSLETVHDRPTVRFSAVNLQVVNGTGDTSATNGTGNLLVGYDRLRRGSGNGYAEECSLGSDAYGAVIDNAEECLAAGGSWMVDHKGGSHYLVVGDEHNYSQWGGALTGFGNTSSARWASVTGGYRNTAGGAGASVSGGAFGTAAGGISSIGGGYENRAIGDYSSVSGGWAGMASGSVSSIAGGYLNEASAINSSVTGGVGNEASGDGTSVTGGSLNRAIGYRSSVSGGYGRAAKETYGWTAGAAAE